MTFVGEEILIGIQVGNLTFTFKTDYEGSNIKVVTKAIKRILSNDGTVLRSFESQSFSKNVGKAETVQLTATKRAAGKAETSLVTRKLQETLIPKGYFKSARTTGDVNIELKKETGISFTSRKVSQALGDLFKKGFLSRVGSRERSSMFSNSRYFTI